MSDSSREFAVGCEKERGRKDDSQKPKHSHYHKSVSDYDTIQRKIEILQGDAGPIEVEK